MVKLHPSSTVEQPLAQIFTVQGHPEFTPSIVSHIVDARSATGVFNPTATIEARRRLGGKDGSGGEGFGRVGWAIWRVLLQELPTAASKYRDVDRVLDRRGPWTADEFVGGTTVSEAVITLTDDRRKRYSAPKLKS